VQLVRAPDTDRLRQLIIVDKVGRRVSIEAEIFVLAGGGLEVTRLLLDSDKHGPGLGNRYDKLGRYYSCHFENICARLVPGRTKVPFAFEKTLDGVYARRKLQFSAQAQRSHRLLNSTFRLHFPPYSDAGHQSAVMSMIYVAKAALIREHAMILSQGRNAAKASPVSAHLRNIALGLPHLCRFGLEWIFLRKLAQRKLPYTLVPNADGSYPLEFNSEQTPLAASRVSLTHERDRHGMRRIRVDWRISQDDIDAAYRAFVLLRATLHQYSSCRLEFDESKLYTSLNNSIPLGGHHIGSTRMAANAHTGVVDRHCALFELPNLYIASASVFPTSGHANPTLTIVALAIRLADHLKEKLRRHPCPARERGVHK
jgi:choline dehydrogenase-like flavoprotein